MDDYLSEAEQWEWLKGQIREYGLWILGGILLGAVGIGAWFAWKSHTDSVAEAAHVQYEELRQAFGTGDSGQAMIKLGELERRFPNSPYVDQARLLAARSFVEKGDFERGAAELKRVADNSRDPQLALVARLRLARVQLAQKQPDAALATLADVKAGAFEARFREVRGDAYYAKGDKTRALQEYHAAREAQLLADASGGAGGGPEHSLLDLKISDLVAEVPPAARAASPAASPAPVPGQAPPVTGAVPAPAK